MPTNLTDLIQLGQLPNCNLVGNLISLQVNGFANFTYPVYFTNSNSFQANGFCEFNSSVDFNNQVVFSNTSNVFFDSFVTFESTGQVGFEGLVYFDEYVTFQNNAEVDFNIPLANIYIYGGSNGQVLTTDGNGNLSWTAGTGGTSSFIANGTSNVSIPSANGNVLISAAGNANVVIVTGSEFRVNNKIANLGNVANVEIGGGNYGWILGTGGSANLAWIPGPYSWVTNYGILSGAPAYANATANRNEPLIYVGADPGANYVWPWYQNTSTTANGYAANSTGTLTPANAAILTGNLLSNTITGGWYKLTETTVNDSNTYYVSSITTLRTYANTTNVEFQIVPYVGYTGNNNVALQTNKLETYLVTNDAPATFVATSFYSYYNNANYDVTGYYIRNITASSELTVVTCEQEVLLHI